MNTRFLRFWPLCCGALGFAAVVLAQEAAPVVQVSKPIIREIEDVLSFKGHAEAAQTVDVRSRVSSTLAHVTFPAGAAVNQGDVLFELDPRAYQLEVAGAEADLRRAEAQLKEAEARVDTSKRLLNLKAITQEEFRQADAARENAAALIPAAKVKLDLARLNLSNTKIMAPISGKLGRALLTPGNLVSAYTTPLATLVSADPVHVYFDVDELTVMKLQKQRRDGLGKETHLAVTVSLPGDKGAVLQARIDAIDVRLDPAKGTQRWRAVLPNEDQLLLPGLSVKVQLKTRPAKTLLISEVAFQTAPTAIDSVRGDDGTRNIVVVNEKNLLEQRQVKIGGVHDGLRVVKEGLTENDRLFVEGRYIKTGVTAKGTLVTLWMKNAKAVTPREVEMPKQLESSTTIDPNDPFGGAKGKGGGKKGGKAVDPNAEPGKAGKGGKGADPNAMFDWQAQGKEFINLAEMRFVSPDLQLWVEQNGVKDGKITREMYLKYYNAKDDLKKQLQEKGK